MTDETYTISIIPPNRVREVWSRARPHLERAIKFSNGRWTSDYVLASLVLNEQQLWITIDSKDKVIGAVTTQVACYPERTMLAIHFLGGDDFDGWYEYLLATLLRYAKDAGCDGIECVARNGFWKWFKRDGFEKDSSFYEKKA